MTPAQKNMSISVITLKPSQFLSPAQKQANFDPNTEVKSILDPHSKNKSILHAPRHEDQVNFDADSKPSHFRPPHKTKSIMIPTLKSSQLRSPTLNHVYFDHPHNNQVNFDANTKIMSFSRRVTVRVIHTSRCSCVAAAVL